MKVYLQDVRQVFIDVLESRMTREKADRWAYSLIQQSESGVLTFLPLADKGRIWDGIMYLYGIDIMESPGEYLHTDEDIRAAMKVIFGNQYFSRFAG